MPTTLARMTVWSGRECGAGGACNLACLQCCASDKEADQENAKEHSKITTTIAAQTVEPFGAFSCGGKTREISRLRCFPPTILDPSGSIFGNAMVPGRPAACTLAALSVQGSLHTGSPLGSGELAHWQPSRFRGGCTGSRQQLGHGLVGTCGRACQA
jgi:hypothetical protein